MMKKCKECKREVPNSKWSYKDDLCTRCDYRKRRVEKNPEYAKSLKELKGLSKDDLIKRLLVYRGNRAYNNMLFVKKNWQIRHFRTKLMKIRNQIDYLLKHPFSNDNGFSTNKHKRDGVSLSQHYQDKKQYARRKENDKGKNK